MTMDELIKRVREAIASMQRELCSSTHGGRWAAGYRNALVGMSEVLDAIEEEEPAEAPAWFEHVTRRLQKLEHAGELWRAVSSGTNERADRLAASLSSLDQHVTTTDALLKGLGERWDKTEEKLRKMAVNVDDQLVAVEAQFQELENQVNAIDGEAKERRSHMRLCDLETASRTHSAKLSELSDVLADTRESMRALAGESGQVAQAESRLLQVESALKELHGLPAKLERLLGEYGDEAATLETTVRQLSAQVSDRFHRLAAHLTKAAEVAGQRTLPMESNGEVIR
jgi:DNA repair ATPase RecN